MFPLIKSFYFLWLVSFEDMLITLVIYIAVISYSAVFSETDDVLRSERADEYVPCDVEWYYFREKCYRAWGRDQKTFERLSWERALERCRNYGGDLVSIQSQDEQDFIVSFLQLDVKSWVWIGLNDRQKEFDFKWTDGSVVNYRNWNVNQPDGHGPEEEDCVHMWFEPEKDIIGKWNDRSCNIPETYICEKNTSPSKRSPNPMYCTSEADGGWEFQDSCYHVVTEKKSWHDAEEYCKDNYKGHLVSILDTLEDLFLDYILATIKTELWIGIKIQEQLQQKWSSGWYVSYDDFNKEQVNFVEGTCTARKKRKEWITIPCTNILSFICKVSKESPPVLKLPARESRCPKEYYWRDLGGDNCYFIEKEKTLNFNEASFDCNRRGGNLLSLHSKEESDVLLSFVKYVRRSIFIGLLRHLDREEEFTWTDGSPMDYENWNTNEPNNKEEKCAEAITHDNPNGRIFTWNDILCGEKRSYICSVKKISTSSTFAEDKKFTNFSNSSLVEDDECTCHVSLKSLIGVVVCIFLMIIFLSVMMYYFRPCGAGHRNNSTSTSTAFPSTSTNCTRDSFASELPLKDYQLMI